MGNADRITGQKALNILDLLVKNRTILQMNIIGTGYECLTIVTRTVNEDNLFVIDLPGDDKIIQNSPGKKASFEFSDKDMVQYRFGTEIVKIEKEGILLRSPESIERMQRREHYRVDAPSGTKLVLELMKRKYEFNVVNLSEGGALLNRKATAHDSGMQYECGTVNNVYLAYNQGGQNVRVKIKKADIIRIDKRTETRQYSYAIKFMDLDKKAEDEIRRFIYMCQRKVLKKRNYVR